MSSSTASQIDNDLYNRMSDTWWDDNGLLSLLKWVVNPWRVPYFQRILLQLKIAPKHKRALDVGCGGGLCEKHIHHRGHRGSQRLFLLLFFLCVPAASSALFLKDRIGPDCLSRCLRLRSWRQ
jgi:hypothetical protein